MTGRVSVTMEDGVAEVRMTRADKLNALDGAMFEALIEAGDRLKGEAGLRAVVFSGEGPSFCAGLDVATFELLNAPSTPAPAGAPRRLAAAFEQRSFGIANRVQYAVWVWREVPVPVIAALHGAVLGTGLQLSLGADIRYVAPDARLAFVEVDWGLVPDMATTQLLRGLVREDLARELIYSCRMFSGAQAVSYGFATRAAADPRGEALELAHIIARKSPDAVRAVKRLLNAAVVSEPAAGLVRETEEQVALIGSPNQIEAAMANIEQRTPKFTDPAV
ncbi:MAG: crotonase/enoyl-CoA hydratase family protein [Caulobacterales bacterium]